MGVQLSNVLSACNCTGLCSSVVPPWRFCEQELSGRPVPLPEHGSHSKRRDASTGGELTETRGSPAGTGKTQAAPRLRWERHGGCYGRRASAIEGTGYQLNQVSEGAQQRYGVLPVSYGTSPENGVVPPVPS